MPKIMLNGVNYSAPVASGVSGVKGNAESEYRTGNVNITKNDVGLGNVANERQYSASNPQPSVEGSSGSCTGNAATATKWKTARTINGMSVDGSANGTNYGVCYTAAATVEKTVVCTEFSLVTGAEMTVKFIYANTAANPALNVNNLGAKPIYYRGSAITAGLLGGDRTYTFRYNGAQWEVVGDLDATSFNGDDARLKICAKSVPVTFNSEGLAVIQFPAAFSEKPEVVVNILNGGALINAVPTAETLVVTSNIKNQGGYVKYIAIGR